MMRLLCCLLSAVLCVSTDQVKMDFDAWAAKYGRIYGAEERAVGRTRGRERGLPVDGPVEHVGSAAGASISEWHRNGRRPRY